MERGDYLSVVASRRSFGVFHDTDVTIVILKVVLVVVFVMLIICSCSKVGTVEIVFLGELSRNEGGMTALWGELVLVVLSSDDLRPDRWSRMRHKGCV